MKECQRLTIPCCAEVYSALQEYCPPLSRVKISQPTWQYLYIPNRTVIFLVRLGGISGEFGRAMVRILARRSRAKISMARPNEPDMPPKRTKKARLGIYRTQIQPKWTRYTNSSRHLARKYARIFQCPRILSVPRSEQFSESEARGKLWATRNR